MQCKVTEFSSLFSHPDYRWDGEYLCFEPYKNPSIQYVPIGDTLISSQYGVSIEMNEDRIGTKIYRMNEISNIIADSDVSKYAELDDDDIDAYRLHDKDVLFNRTNSLDFVGRTGIFRKFHDEDIVFASYLVRLTPDGNIVTPECLTAFLNTKYGMLDVRRRARISINQSNVNPEELKRVEIPLLSSELQQRITHSFDSAFNLIQSSEVLYQEAQALLLSELGLADWQPKRQTESERNFSDVWSAGRMDAEYYQPKYDEIESIIKKYPNGYALIGDEFTQSKNSFEIEAEKLYHYVEIGSVNVATGEITASELLGADLPANAKLVLNNSDLIVSKVRTYRGAITIVTEDGYVGSGAFCTLRESGRINKETLLVFLHSKPLLEYSLKPNRGTSYPVIVDDDILKMPVPLVDPQIQEQIRQKITESFDKRRQSRALLECAKRAVEIAIEQDEATAVAWLEDAVAAAYGWDADLSDEQVLERVLALNLERYEGEGG